MQDQPPPEPPKIDIGGIVSGIVQGFQVVLQGWADQLPQRIYDSATDPLVNLWEGIWHSGINIFATPLELTKDYPPAQTLFGGLVLLVPSIGLIAIVLLCLRNLWGIASGTSSMRYEAVNGILLGLMMSSASTLVIIIGFALTVQASDAIGHIDYAPALEPKNLLTNQVPFNLMGIFTFFIMLYYGWKLICRGAYRVVLLMFSTPFSPIAGALLAIPQARWISVRYYVMWGGWLAGGFFAVAAISLGMQLAVFHNQGLQSLVFGVALLQLAYDLMSWLAGGPGGGNAPRIGMPTALAAGAAGGAAVAAANQGANTVVDVGQGVAGALPAGEESGFGY